MNGSQATTGAYLYHKNNEDSKNLESALEFFTASLVRKGEQPVYRTERDPMTQVVKTDYVLITVQPLLPGRLIAVLGGLDTTGTEGETQFATSRLGVQQLLDRLRSLGVAIDRGSSFQALLSWSDWRPGCSRRSGCSLDPSGWLAAFNRRPVSSA
jgi:hypothetical protein